MGGGIWYVAGMASPGEIVAVTFFYGVVGGMWRYFKSLRAENAAKAKTCDSAGKSKRAASPRIGFFSRLHPGILDGEIIEHPKDGGGV